MMRSEFIERTGFEPTAAEYEEIENEYMGTDIDKDEFCKMWKKQGGAERLMRIRARRIEELEAEVQRRAREYDELDRIRCESLMAEQNKREEIERKLEEQMQESDARLTKEIIDRQAWEVRAIDAETKLSIITEAFEIMTGKEKGHESE